MSGGSKVDIPLWVRSLTGQGLHPTYTHFGHCWIPLHRWCQMRYPPNDLARLEPGERRDLFFRKRALLITHHHEPGPDEKPNAWLYLVRDRDYDIEKLSANNRSKIRRGLKRLTIRQIEPREVARTGYPCVADTATRNNNSPPSENAFRQRWESARDHPHYEIWGALADNELAAFLVMRFCGRFVEFVSSCSANTYLKNYPNHALFYSALKRALSEPGVESVSYGLSSLQVTSRIHSLHEYKLSIGFEAIPVVRCVDVHPLIRPFFNPLTRLGLRIAERRFPRTLIIRKTRGLLELVSGGDARSMPQTSDDA